MPSPNSQQAYGGGSDEGDKPRLYSLVPLMPPVHMASIFACEPQQFDEDALQKLHTSLRTSIGAYRNWNQYFEAPQNQFTEIGFRVFSDFFQSFASFLESEWNSQMALHALDALRASLAALSQAQDSETLLAAHLAVQR